MPPCQGRTSEEDFTIRLLDNKDKEKVLDFLNKFFFRDEPMNVAVKLLDTPEARCPPLEEYALASLDDEVSLVAVDRAHNIVGVLINGIARRDEPVDLYEKADKCPDAKFSRVLRVLAHLEEHARVWEHVGDARAVLEVRIASTHTAWRGKGLMRRLCEEAEKLARKEGCGALRMDATSAFSAAAAERLGYKSIYSALYADIPDAPQPQPPHLAASVYVKII